MTSKSCLTYEDTDYARHIQEALHELHQLQQTPRLVTSPDELEALEREIRQHTDRLGSLLVGHHLQQALDSTALQAEQDLTHLAGDVLSLCGVGDAGYRGAVTRRDMG